MSREAGIRLRLKRAWPTVGKLDFDGEWLEDPALYGRAKKVSIGIFRWEKMRSKNDIKRGKVFRRVHCYPSTMKQGIARAETICLALEAGGDNGSKAVD